MQGIEVYLKKFEQFGFKERELTKNIKQAILDICGVEVSDKEISIHDGVLRVLMSGAGKSEIFIKRREIETRFEEIIKIL
jgi:hypothetical protein